jgi:hypothetical protein
MFTIGAAPGPVCLVALVFSLSLASGASANDCEPYARYLHWAGTAQTPGSARAAVEREGFLYVADGNGFAILSIDDVGRTAIVSQLPFSVAVLDVALGGAFAYLAADLGGLVTVNISNPAHPVVVSSRGLGSSIAARAVDVAGTLVFVAAARSGPAGNLYAFDASSPGAPRMLDTVLTPWRATDLHVRDGYAFVTDTMCFETGCMGGLGVFDVSDPTALDEVGYVGLGPVPAFTLAGDHAYVASSIFGVWVVDVSNPPFPLALGSTEEFEGRGVAAEGDVLVVSADDVRVYDITDRELPVETARFAAAAPGTGGGVSLLRGRALVVGEGELQLVDARDPHPLAPVATVLATSSIEAVATSGAMGVLADGTRLRVFDFSDPHAPLEQGEASLPAAASALEIAGPMLYAACGLSGLSIFDLQDPASPVLRRSLRLPGRSEALVYADGFLYVCTRGTEDERAVRVLDVQDPTQPREVDRYVLSDDPVGLDLEGPTLFVAAGAQGLVVFDRTTPDAIVPIGSFVTPFASAVIVREGTARLTDLALGLVHLDVADPARPVLLATMPLTGSPGDITISERHALVSSGPLGCTVVDLRVTADPVPTGWLPSNGFTHGTAEASGHMLVADGSGLHVFEPPCRLQLVPPAGTTPRPAAVLSRVAVGPNGTATITVDLAETSPLSVRLYDARGRLIRTLANDVLPPGRHAFGWDGTSRAGRSAPSGVYFYVAAIPGRSEGGRFVMAR